MALLPLLTTSFYCSLVLNCRQLVQCTKNRHTQQSAAIGCGVVRDNYLPAPPLWWGALSSSLSQEAIETVVPTRTAASKKIFMYLFMMSFVLRGEYSDLLIIECADETINDDLVYFIVEEALQIMLDIGRLPVVSRKTLIGNFFVGHAHVFKRVAVIIEHAVFP